MRAEQDRHEREDSHSSVDGPPRQRDLRTQSATPVVVIFCILLVLIGMMVLIWQLAVRAAGT